MKYLDGRKVELGDEVTIGGESNGVVVCVISDGEYSSTFPKDEWGYLKQGFLVNSDKMGLIHYSTMEDEIKFVRRVNNDRSS